MPSFAGSIWIVGSSIIEKAEKFAKSTELGTNLGIDSRYKITWSGISGLTWERVVPTIDNLCFLHPSPDVLVIHCGGNDIGTHSLWGLQGFMKRIMYNLIQRFPQTCVVWSHILPRRYWRHALSCEAADKSRMRINSSISAFTLKHGGAYISYPDIVPFHNSKMLQTDGVHLSMLGNSNFINTLQGAINTFTSSDCRIYPNL